MDLHQLPKRNNRKKSGKRVGRGYGGGKGGHTTGSGQKGQKSRTGGGKPVGFEGGNVPLYRRLPKFRGFTNPTRVEYQPINFAELSKHFKSGETVSMETLRKKGMVRKNTRRVKILGKGELTKELKFSGVEISNQAREVVDQSRIKGKSTKTVTKGSKAKGKSKKSTVKK